MEILLQVLFVVKFYAYLAGIASFTLMCAIGTVMAIDELKDKLHNVPSLSGLRQRVKRRRQLKWQKRQEELAWADYFSDLPHNFLPDGAILRPQEKNEGYFR